MENLLLSTDWRNRMNKHQFKIWLEKDHFACFPGLKGFFDKRTEDERKAIYRKWVTLLQPYQEGWAIKASELLMQDSEGLMPQDHPARVAAICRRLQPRQRDETLQALDISEEQREEMKKWPQLYPHIGRMLKQLGQMKDIILEERSQITSAGLLKKFDEEAKSRMDETAEVLKKECEALRKEIEANRSPSKSPPAATSTPSPSTDTHKAEVPVESKSVAQMGKEEITALKQTFIELDGKEDIPF